MLKMNMWLSKYGVVAPYATLAIVAACGTVVVQAYAGVEKSDQVVDKVSVAVIRHF